MEKTLSNYLTTDEKGFQLIAQRCHYWKKTGIRSVPYAIREILLAGGLIGTQPRTGVHVLGNMNNSEVGISGDIWVTALVTECDENRIVTASGSEYQLLQPFAHRDECTPYVVNDEPLEWGHQILQPSNGASVDEIFRDPIRYCPR